MNMGFYDPVAVGVNASVNIEARAIGGFFAAIAGTLTITGKNSGRVIVNAAPVVAGWNVMPFSLGRNAESEFTFTTAGGASGWVGLAA